MPKPFGGNFHIDGTNLSMQTPFVSAIMNQNIAVILQQFNMPKLV